MKKLAVTAVFVFLFLSSGYVFAEEMTMEAKTSITQESSEIIINFIPKTPGKTGDGFIVSVNGTAYFLPEGEKITLTEGAAYFLDYSRAYKTSRGWVIGVSTSLPPINPNGEMGIIKGLKSFDRAPFSCLVPLIACANFQSMGYLLCGGYMDPPFLRRMDAVRVEFDAQPRVSIAPSITMFFSAGEEMFFKIPPEYSSATYWSMIYDDDRIIISTPTSLR